MLIACVAGGVRARLLGGMLAAALAFAACTFDRTPVGLGPPFLRVISVTQASDAAATSPPAWSPGGRAIAFGTDDGVWQTGADGTGLRRLASLPRVTEVAWSPDGRTLAIVAGDTLYAVYLDGRPPQPVSAVPGAHLATWAPHATRLAYVVPGGGDHDVIVTWTDGETDGRGAAPVPVALPDGFTVQAISWAPGGLEFLVALAPHGKTTSTRLLRIQAALLHPRVVPIRRHDAMIGPVFDPFARFVAYIGPPDGASGTRGRVMAERLDGTGRRSLTSSGRYVGLSWAPSGTLVAFGTVVGSDETLIHVADVTTGAQLRVADYHPELAEYARALVTRWAPDGVHLAFGTDTGEGRGPIWMATLERR